MCFVSRFALLLAASAGLLQAACCAPYAQAVVTKADAAVVSLREYNSEMDKTIAELRSAVALSMASAIEKERQLADLSAIKKTMGLRADTMSLLIRKKVVAIDAELFSLNTSYSSEIEKELNEMEQK